MDFCNFRFKLLTMSCTAFPVLPTNRPLLVPINLAELKLFDPVPSNRANCAKFTHRPILTTQTHKKESTPHYALQSKELVSKISFYRKKAIIFSFDLPLGPRLGCPRPKSTKSANYLLREPNHTFDSSFCRGFRVRSKYDQKKIFEVPLRVKTATFCRKSYLPPLSAVNLYLKKSSKVCVTPPE